MEMKPRIERTCDRWLAAEQRGDDDGAELALAELFAALPLPVPAAGFADRVLRGAGLPPLSAVYPRWSRVAISACLLVVGAALAYTLPLALGLSRLVAPAEVAGALVQGIVGLLSRVDEVVELGRLLAAVVRTSWLVMTAPPVVATLLALTALAALTLRGLSELVSSNRNRAYVQAL